MITLLRLKIKNDPNLFKEFANSVAESGIDTRKPSIRIRGTQPLEIIVALGSAGVFSVFYKLLHDFLGKNKDREITVENKKIKLTLKGHSLPEEKMLLEQLAPELMSKPKENKKVNSNNELN